MTTTLTALDKRVLDCAASLLDTTARHSTPGEVSLRCLLAVERLALAGAEPSASTIAGTTGSSDRVRIGHALKLLGALPDDLLDDEWVLDAMNHALLAHAATK